MSFKKLRVLVGCEYSGTVRDAFIKRGHDAISCDLLPTDAGGPHYKGDIFDIIGDGFDIGIFHPPCTYLSNSGVCHLYTNATRWKDLISGAVFFRKLLLSRHLFKIGIGVENPIQHKYAREIIGEGPTQIVQPWMFGHTEKKATGLWLKDLPALIPTNNVKEETEKLPKNQQQRLHYLPPSADRWKLRSTTFKGIADAMAYQWGSLS